MQSMTGYGEAIAEEGEAFVRVEITSVNRRHKKVKCNLEQARFKKKIIERIAGDIHRGTIYVKVESNVLGRERHQPNLNREAVTRYLEIISELSAEQELVAAEVSATELLALPGVVEVKTVSENDDRAEVLLESALDEAIENFITSRREEGRTIAGDLLDWIGNIRDYTDKIEERVPEALARYREDILQSVESILGLVGEEKENRLKKELENYAEKCDISEELSRLRSHLNQFKENLNNSDPVGRNLEFLLQEIQREVNTIGAKGNDAQISQLAVDIKTELEKCREQVKNLE